MDSRVVNKEIKAHIWPLLRNDGFTKFTSRTAWRDTPEQIHVVNFQSFNSYLADGVGCTTFSFALNLGIYFRAIPRDPLMGKLGKGVDPAVKPEEYHCHLRHRLLKDIEQPVLPRRDTWYVEPDGGNLPVVMSDARSVLQTQGLAWFGSLRSREGVLSLLMEQGKEDEARSGRMSPMGKRMIGYIGRSFGKEGAEQMIVEAEQEFEAIRVQLFPKRKGTK